MLDVRRGGARSFLAIAIAALAFACTLAIAGRSRADTPRAKPAPIAMDAGAPATGAATVDAGSSLLDLAKSLFRSGVAMFDAGDFERALDFFVRSRDAYPSAINTMNAAICLDKLGRFDESLEMYETTLASFGEQLDAGDRSAIANATAVLRTKVASVEVTASSSGTVLVDGRERGKVPMSTPVRVLAGKHVVRVVKDGYATWEASIEPKPGDHVTLDAKLEPLAAAGQLRIEDPAGGEGARVFVDAVVVGPAPWEGTLGPGPHVAWSQKGDVGSAPTAVTVLQGQTSLLRLKSGPLGPVVRIEAKPPTASIVLGGVAVGTGVFELRLPSGDYVAEAKEPGYFPQSAPFSVVAHEANAAPMKVSLSLAIDPNDPRWPKPVVRIEPAPGNVWVGAFGGLALGSTFGSDAESSCPSRCTTDTGVSGPLVGARVGFRFRMGLSVEVSGAYFSATQSIDRTRSAVFPTNAPRYTATYALHDDLALRGPLASIGVSQRITLLSWLALLPRATVGVLLGKARDPVTGTASAGGEAAPAQITGAGDSQTATRIVVTPEIGAVVPWKSFEFGAALGLAILPGTGPHFSNGAVQVAPSCTSSAPGAIGCAPSSALLANERAMGPFYLWVPQLNVTYLFY